MALQCGSGRAFLSGADRTVGGDRAWEGRHGRLCLRPCLVSTSRWTARGLSPTGNTTATCSIYVDPFTMVCVNGATARPRKGTREDEDNDNKENGGKSANRGGGREPVSPEKIDEWMRACAVEIVGNIGEAPFLVHVFSSNKERAALRLEREAADAERWPAIRSRWDRGATTPPDGVILVEELNGETGEGGAAASWGEDDDGASKTWGVLVQGWGADCAACYVLNTCRIRSASGFCTHFCLARARCFGDTADAQLKKSWLVGKQHRQPQQ